MTDRPGPGSSVMRRTSLLAALAAAGGCEAPPLDPREELVLRGERVFFFETFDGNGRTCGSCHRSERNFGIDAAFIATLPPDDPLFVAERNPDWALHDDRTLTTIVPGPLAPGGQVTIQVTLAVVAPGQLDNLAEIALAHDDEGRTPPDVDSVADTDPDNDVLVDDIIDNTDGDEDDHDIATIQSPRFDLALRKTIDDAQESYAIGDTVPFRITVFNQGDVTAKDVLASFSCARLMAVVVWDYIDKVEAADDYTINFHMNVPSTVVQRYVLKFNTVSAVDYGEWERWSLDDLHSEHALYAVIYQPA